MADSFQFALSRGSKALSSCAILECDVHLKMETHFMHDRLTTGICRTCYAVVMNKATGDIRA